MISLYSGDAAAGPLFDIEVNMGSLLSELDWAMLQCKHQAISPLSHHTEQTYSKYTLDRLDAEGEGFVKDKNDSALFNRAENQKSRCQPKR